MNYIGLERRELPYEIAEELKSLRTNLQFCGKDKKVLMLTSCLSGEGKSTLSPCSFSHPISLLPDILGSGGALTP